MPEGSVFFPGVGEEIDPLTLNANVISFMAIIL